MTGEAGTSSIDLDRLDRDAIAQIIVDTHVRLREANGAAWMPQVASQAADAILALSASRGSGVPEGWGEPTEEMLVAMWRADGGHYGDDRDKTVPERIRSEYVAMAKALLSVLIAAAPTPSGGGGLADG